MSKRSCGTEDNFRDLGVAMRIRHFGGIETASTRDELRRILSKRFENESNEFWIFADNKEFSAWRFL